MDDCRILLAAPKSGSGKTMITCGTIELLKRRGMKVASFKCGPDYIDPMFHRRVFDIASGNLDTYFTDEETTRYLLWRKAKESDITVIEGVMGYYDGLGGVSVNASTYEVSRVTETPVILILDGKGASVTLAALVKGIQTFKTDSHIAGVILNRTSAGYYRRIAKVIEDCCHVPVVGYLPELKDLSVPSRHLGLISPEEIAEFDAWIGKIADVMEETVDMEQILSIAGSAGVIQGKQPERVRRLIEENAGLKPVPIGIAMDEAFSFYYSENLTLLRKLGAELIPFSPLHDKILPEGIQGLILGGGYPENYVEQLACNKTMLQSIKSAADKIYFLAECGGFLYLQKAMEDMEGNVYSMAGVLEGQGYHKKKLSRFGYMQCTMKHGGFLGEASLVIKGHEFHYFDCTDNGTDCLAVKPMNPDSSYECMVYNEHIFAGFPHFYYYSNVDMVAGFVKACRKVNGYEN